MTQDERQLLSRQIESVNRALKDLGGEIDQGRLGVLRAKLTTAQHEVNVLSAFVEEPDAYWSPEGMERQRGIDRRERAARTLAAIGGGR